MAASQERIINALRQAFESSDIECEPLVNDDEHWKVSIKSSQFAGKSLIQQHRMVQRALGHLDIHALSIQTQT